MRPQYGKVVCGLRAHQLCEALRLEGERLELEPVPVSMRLVRRGKGLLATTDEPLPKIGATEVRTVLDSLRRESPST